MVSVIRTYFGVSRTNCLPDSNCISNIFRAKRIQYWLITFPASRGQLAIRLALSELRQIYFYYKHPVQQHHFRQRNAGPEPQSSSLAIYTDAG